MRRDARGMCVQGDDQSEEAERGQPLASPGDMPQEKPNLLTP